MVVTVSMRCSCAVFMASSRSSGCPATSSTSMSLWWTLHSSITLLMSFDSNAERIGSPRGPSGVSATICATKPKFLSSAPEIRSPIKSLLQPAYWQRPPALAHNIVRVSGVRALVRARLVLPAPAAVRGTGCGAPRLRAWRRAGVRSQIAAGAARGQDVRRRLSTRPSRATLRNRTTTARPRGRWSDQCASNPTIPVPAAGRGKAGWASCGEYAGQKLAKIYEIAEGVHLDLSGDTIGGLAAVAADRLERRSARARIFVKAFVKILRAKQSRAEPSTATSLEQS